MSIYCLIMAGGKGTRFWPESTRKKPKQYLSLLSDRSLLEETLDRFDGFIPNEYRYIVTIKEQEELAAKCASGKMAASGLIFEPSGRNTAPCILLSLATLQKNGAKGSDVMAIVPADHVILNQQGFQEVINKAGELALRDNKIITIGIPPTFPHTGYGYIEKGESFSNLEAGSAFKVRQFKEKPDYDRALEYLKSGNYFWNAGMFVSRIDVMLKEFAKNAPEIHQHYGALYDSIGDFQDVEKVYAKIPKNSIDYAVMEKSSEIVVVPASFDWNDLGSWDALESVIKPQDNNVVASSLDNYFDNAKGNIVYAPNKFVSLINVEDLIVVVNDSSVLVIPKKDSQKVKAVVEHLKGHSLGEKLL